MKIPLVTGTLDTNKLTDIQKIAVEKANGFSVYCNQNNLKAMVVLERGDSVLVLSSNGADGVPPETAALGFWTLIDAGILLASNGTLRLTRNT